MSSSEQANKPEPIVVPFGQDLEVSEYAWAIYPPVFPAGVDKWEGEKEIQVYSCWDGEAPESAKENSAPAVVIPLADVSAALEGIEQVVTAYLQGRKAELSAREYSELLEELHLERFGDSVPKALVIQWLRLDNSWSLKDALVKLCEAADILLREKDYGGDGWEQIACALDVGRVAKLKLEEAELLLARPSAIESPEQKAIRKALELLEQKRHPQFECDLSGQDRREATEILRRALGGGE